MTVAKRRNTKFRMSIYEENQMLKASLNHMREELSKFKNPPLVVCSVKKVVGDKVIVKLPNGNNFYVDYVSNLKNKLKPGHNVLAEQKSLTVVEKIDGMSRFNVDNFVIIEKPDVGWESIGGLVDQIREVKEVIELPLKSPDVFDRVGIQPPKGILLHGEPGTGKTMLAKAVAKSTNATFIEVVGSELVQKFIGEGAKLVSEIFKLAKEKAPSIVFIDELDALAAQRVDVGTSGEREVQRTFMQLLAEIDGFDNLGDVKVIGATNRLDILDRAIIRPGRLDRLIEVPLPCDKGRKDIFKIHTSKMNLDGVDFDELVRVADNLSGAEIRAVCTEAGYFAIRAKRNKIFMNDFLNAIDKVKKDEEDQEHKNFFG